MKWLALGALLVLLSGVALLGGAQAPNAKAQDTAQDRLAALETAVTNQSEEIERLGARVATLEAGAGVASGAPSAQATQATQVAGEKPAEGASAGQGTRDDPVPLGTAADVGDWTVKVTDVVPDATKQIATQNQFNEPPPAGSQFFLITLEATYHGDKPAPFWVSMSYSVVGQSATSYSSGSNGCGVVPKSMLDVPEVFEGGTIEGNICFAVRAEDVDTLVLYLSPLISLGNDDVFFALRRD